MGIFKRKKKDERSPRLRSNYPGSAHSRTQYYSAGRERPTVKQAAHDRRVGAADSKQRSLEPSRLRKIVQYWPQKLLFVAILVVLGFSAVLSKTVVRYDTADSYRPAEDYTLGIQEIFDSNPVYKTKISLQSSDFERDIERKFPELSRSTVIVPLAGRNLLVGLYFAKPLVRLQTTDQSSQGVITSDGTFVAIKDSKGSDQVPLMTLVNVPSIISEGPGTQLLTTDETSLVKVLLDEFDNSNEARPKVSSIIFDIQKREMQVRFNSVKYYAKITPEREAREQVGSLVATIQELQQRGSTPTEYIDVRVEDRVFVK